MMHEESHEMDHSYDDGDRQNRFGGNQVHGRNSMLKEIDNEANDTYQHNDTYADISDDEDDKDHDGMESKAEYNSEDDEDMNAHY